MDGKTIGVVMGLALSSLGAGAQAADRCELQVFPLPVTMVDLQPQVDAKINGKPVRLVLDSGAFYSYITPGVAAEMKLHLAPAPPNFELEGIGGRVVPSIVTVKFDVGAASLSGVQFLTGGGESGGGTAGLLGQNFLFREDVEYDFANGVARLVHPVHCGGGAMAYWIKPGSSFGQMRILRFETSGRYATTGMVEVNGHQLRAQFDTGSGVSFMSLAAAKRLGFNPSAAGVEDAGAFGGLGRRLSHSWLMPVDDLKIGDEQIRHTKLRVGEGDIPGDIDMLIGADFFLSHRIYVSNAHELIYFTYNGGPVFDLRNGAPSAPAPVATTASIVPQGLTGEPHTADEFARRGSALLERHDYTRAIADLDRAHEMAPQEASYLVRRAAAHEAAGETAQAADDLDAAVRLAPDDAPARVDRAALRLASGRPAAGVADLDAADRLLSPQADQRLEMIHLYLAARVFTSAIRQADLWIKAHPDDGRRAVALNARCWAGGLSGADLDAALTACNAAVRAQPKMATFLDSRGLVRLRRGENDEAIKDYDAALTLDPRIGWSLYGRSVAERRKGLLEAAKSDLSRATAANPKIVETAASYGLTS